MKRSTLSGAVALIIIFGHMAVFIVGLMLGVFRLLSGTDALQTLLMASPVLATTAAAALTHVLNRDLKTNDRSREDPFVVGLCLTIPVILIGAIFAIFLMFYRQVDGFGPDQLKVTLGALEAAFGAFLGAISRKLFGAIPPAKATHS